MKICNSCNEVGEFRSDARSSDGLQGICRECQRKYQREYNKTYNSLQSTRDYKRDRELKDFWPDCSPKQARENYNTLYARQDGCCAVCQKHQSEFSISLSVDHDHDTGFVRGLLCGNCNRGLGLFMDSEDSLMKAASYISKNKEIKLVAL